jgi:hypothetical protein
VLLLRFLLFPAVCTALGLGFISFLIAIRRLLLFFIPIRIFVRLFLLGSDLDSVFRRTMRKPFFFSFSCFSDVMNSSAFPSVSQRLQL